MLRWLRYGLLALVCVQFRASVDVALVNVTVVDSRGVPVEGLTAADFDVEVSGRRAAVLAVDFRRVSSAAGVSATSSSATSVLETPAINRSRSVVLLFDDLSFKPASARELSQAFEVLAPRLGADDTIGLFTTSGLGPAIAPSRQRDELLQGLRRLAGRREDVTAPFFIGVDEALGSITRAAGASMVKRECEIHDLGPACADAVRSAARREERIALRRTEEQIKSLRDTIAAMRELPEPRVLIFLSDGIAADPRHGLGDYARSLSAAAATAGVQLYALTGYGDAMDAADLTFERRAARVAERRFLAGGVQTFAHAAGGESFVVIGQPHRFMERIVRETSATYQLAIQLPEVRQGEPPYFDVKVKVKRRGVTVRANPLTTRQPAGR